MKTRLLLCMLPFATFAMPAHAIIAVNSTGSTATGGDPIYLAQESKFSGVVGLMIDWSDGTASTCSGALLSDRRSVVTAGHCTTESGGAVKATSTTVYFDTGVDPNNSIYKTDIAGNVQIEVSATTTHPDYTTFPTDYNDIAVLTLAELAPDWATGYDIYETDDLTGVTFTTVGYGLRSSGGGDTGLNEREDVGSRRQGTNRYDFRLGDDEFNDYYTRGGDRYEYAYAADFDDGTAENDRHCEVGNRRAGREDEKYCDVGTGVTEAVGSYGDSGAPQFVDGKLASINTWGVTNGEVQGLYTEQDGYVPLYVHTDFIKSAMIGAVPEPATWLQMLLGFGILGGAMRARRRDHALATS